MTVDRAILVCMLVRDVEKKIDKQLRIFLESFSIFRESTFLFIESDSKDKTLSKLLELSNQNSKIEIISLGTIENRLQNRIDRLRFCRNAYVAYIRENFEKYDYVAVADFDGVNSKLNSKKILTIFETKLEWDMCSANQSHGYYDLYALRASNWCETDIFIELEKIAKGKTFKQIFALRTRLIYERMKKIPESSDWIGVKSAFGGLAFYRPQVFIAADYSKVNSNSPTQCEHVDFHQKLDELDYKLYINPKLINSHWNTHNINRVKLVRIFRSVLRRFKKHYMIVVKEFFRLIDYTKVVKK